VDFLKREAGETKFGSVPFPEGLVQLLGENAVGHEQAVEVRDKPYCEPKFECLGCEEPCQVQLTCECGGDFCENCSCGTCEVGLCFVFASLTPLFFIRASVLVVVIQLRFVKTAVTRVISAMVAAGR
jgi:hypothetical protein